MPIARAFRALRFSARAGKLADLVAPPYDVIKGAERDRLGSRDAHNLVKLTLPEGDSDPAVPGNRYERAGALMSQWRERGVLVRDPEPSLTVVQEEFDHDGRTCLRTGVQAAVGLDSCGEGRVFGHERTLPGPRVDRLALMRTTKANLSPVFLLVSDEPGEVRAALAEVTARAPDHDVRGAPFGKTASRTRVWIERGAQLIERLEKAVAERPAVVADGHHRYETALTYRDELARAGEDPGWAAHVLSHLVPVEDEGLVVLPYHRAAKPKDAAGVANAEKLLSALEESFDVEEVSREQAADFTSSAPGRDERQGFVVATGNPARLFRAELRDRAAMAARSPEHGEDWRALDVSCLHVLVIEDVLGITPDEVAGGEYVAYSSDLEETVAAVETEGRLGFIVRPTPAEAVLAVARAGELMPQKSTYFFPKVAAGFARRSLW
jgi:uncharacterized protein (DUF1015 family)